MNDLFEHHRRYRFGVYTLVSFFAEKKTVSVGQVFKVRRCHFEITKGIGSSRFERDRKDFITCQP